MLILTCIMANVIEYEKRRADILEKALAVFTEEGYSGATFQKIAERSCITRTTLYHYFKDKREIFLNAIKSVMDNVEENLQEVMKSNFSSCAAQLKAVMDTIINTCSEHQRLLAVILAYLLQVQKEGKDPEDKIRRRTLRWRHIFSRIIIEGQRRGEFTNTAAVKDANSLFYTLLESAVFHIAVLNTFDIKRVSGAVDLAVSLLSSGGGSSNKPLANGL